MSRIFAIGDIHGCSNTFRALIKKINLEKSDIVYCIGDYIDRGADSKGVIDFILQLREQNYQIHTLRGNHEQMMLQSTESEEQFNHWITNGGDATLKNFGVNSVNELSSEYVNFFNNTKYFVETDKYVFVHAGLNFIIPDPFKDEESMLWIRDFSVDTFKLQNRLLIHGHTPKSAKYILSQKFENGVINIDAGCVYKHKGLGNLFAVNLTEQIFIWVKNCK